MTNVFITVISVGMSQLVFALIEAILSSGSKSWGFLSFNDLVHLVKSFNIDVGGEDLGNGASEDSDKHQSGDKVHGSFSFLYYNIINFPNL